MKGEQALKLKECHQKLISDLTTKMQVWNNHSRALAPYSRYRNWCL